MKHLFKFYLGLAERQGMAVRAGGPLRPVGPKSGGGNTRLELYFIFLVLVFVSSLILTHVFLGIHGF